MGIDIEKPFEILKLILVKREEWKAQPTKCVETFDEYPINWVVHGFTGTEECFSREECCQAVRDIQRRDIEQGFCDIKYNFLVGGDWTVYEGRGWTYIPEDPLRDQMKGLHLDLSFIGPYPQGGQRNYPQLEMKLARQRLLEFGIHYGYIDSNFNCDYYELRKHVSSKKPLGDPNFEKK